MMMENDNFVDEMDLGHVFLAGNIEWKIENKIIQIHPIVLIIAQLQQFTNAIFQRSNCFCSKM